jgi:hypothetical protein
MPTIWLGLHISPPPLALPRIQHPVSPSPRPTLEQLLRMLPQQAAEADVHDAVGGLLVQPRRDRLLVVHAGRLPARRRGPPPRPG